MKIRKLLSILLVVALTTVILPAGVFAKSTPCVVFDGISLFEENISSFGSSVSFDENTHTLTLEDANIDGDGYVLSANVDLIVKLIGKNTITSNKGTFGAAFMIAENSSITFVGDGDICLTGDICAVMADNIIASNDVSLMLFGGNYGISGNITVNDNAVVTARGEKFGVSNGSMTVNSGTLVVYGGERAVGFQNPDSTYSFAEGAIVKCGSSETYASIVTETDDLKTRYYTYLYVNLAKREIIYNDEALSETTCTTDGNNLVINVIPRNNYTAEKAVYLDPILDVVKAVDKSVGDENQFVVPNIEATDIAVITKATNIDPEPIILKKTDDTTTAVVLQDDKVIATTIKNEGNQNNEGLFSGSTFA